MPRTPRAGSRSAARECCSSSSLGNEGERLDMAGADGPEMAVIERRYLAGIKALGKADNRSIDDAQWEIDVLSHEIGNALPIRRDHGFGDELTRGECPAECQFRMRADAIIQQIGDFSYHQLGDQQWTGSRRKQFGAPGVVTVFTRSRRIQGTSINYQHRFFLPGAAPDSLVHELVNPF